MAEEELQVGDFNPDTYEHVLPEGAHDFDNYDTDYEEENPELGYTDQQVQEIVEKTGKEERQLYEQCRGFLETYYRQHGRIIEMSDLIKLIMTRRFPEIPSTTREEQDALRDQLMIEARKREMSVEAGLEDQPPRKIKRVVPEFVKSIIEVTGQDDPNEPTIIKVIPREDPYQQLMKEEDEVQYLVGDDESSETHPDDTTADDLSHITLDSLKHIDNEKVKEIWRGMSKLKHQEGEYYQQLAEMVDEMSPETVYQSVAATPHPSTKLPQCAEDLLEDLGSEELFRRILGIGYMAWQKYEENRHKHLGQKYKPDTYRQVSERFNVSTSRLMDLKRGEAISREDTRRRKILKMEKEEEGKTPAASPEQTPAQPSTSAE